MNILINTSNLRIGGGIQVADSICHELHKYPQHSFVIVLSDALLHCKQFLTKYPNVKRVIHYNLPWSLITMLSGRDSFLDRLTQKENIDAVLTIFGPSRWIPQKRTHLCGFARSQMVIPESPFYTRMSKKQLLINQIRIRVMTFLFAKSANALFSENLFITNRLRKLFPQKNIYTITNNYNQIFNKPALWDRTIKLPPYKGFTLLTISANYPHKNLPIIRSAIHHLCQYYAGLNVRFVLTITPEQFVPLTSEEKQHIIFTGPVNIEQCPFLYKQCDAMFLPSLLECFSASYAEAMKMERPILTTDLGFSHSLCGKAACYYDAISVEDLCKKIHLLATDSSLRNLLIEEGKKQLRHYDSYEERGKKLIQTLELEYNKKNSIQK